MKSISKASLSFIKLLSFVLITAIVSLLVVLVTGELMVRWFNPQPITFPKWTVSNQYGHVLPKDRRMDHYLPGKWHYVYTINGYGYHGPQISLSNRYPRNNIVILGDSYAFGTGVQDQEGFAAVMQRDLKGQFDVINLAVGGYGLTQEIRRYYEFGQLYRPSYVILQFCNNDPADNFNNPVTEFHDGRFVFKNVQAHYNWFRSFLGNSSLFQKSQLYNFMRNFIHTRYQSVYRHQDLEMKAGSQPAGGFYQSQEMDEKQENFYSELLGAFARDLSENKVRLILISVNGELNSFKIIHQAVDGLRQAEVITYLEVEPWFKGQSNFGSPEGHNWGVKAHAIIGQHLAAYILGQERQKVGGGASSIK
jgi:hypothetical protein